jgi:hypothetical protein
MSFRTSSIVRYSIEQNVSEAGSISSDEMAKDGNRSSFLNVVLFRIPDKIRKHSNPWTSKQFKMHLPRYVVDQRQIVNIYQATRRHIARDGNLQIYCSEELKISQGAACFKFDMRLQENQSVPTIWQKFSRQFNFSREIWQCWCDSSICLYTDVINHTVTLWQRSMVFPLLAKPSTMLLLNSSLQC